MTPKLAPRCPSLVANTEMIKDLSSFATWGSCSSVRFFKSLGEVIYVNNCCTTAQNYNFNNEKLKE